MPLEPLIGLGILIFAGILGLIEALGKLYGTYRCLIRRDLKAEQRIIYLLLIWMIPLGWLIYFLLGTERTQRLFSGIDVF